MWRSLQTLIGITTLVLSKWCDFPLSFMQVWNYCQPCKLMVMVSITSLINFVLCRKLFNQRYSSISDRVQTDNLDKLLKELTLISSKTCLYFTFVSDYPLWYGQDHHVGFHLNNLAKFCTITLVIAFWVVQISKKFDQQHWLTYWERHDLSWVDNMESEHLKDFHPELEVCPLNAW